MYEHNILRVLHVLVKLQFEFVVGPLSNIGTSWRQFAAVLGTAITKLRAI